MARGKKQSPEQVVNILEFVAKGLRKWLARTGATILYLPFGP